MDKENVDVQLQAVRSHAQPKEAAEDETMSLDGSFQKNQLDQLLSMSPASSAASPLPRTSPASLQMTASNDDGGLESVDADETSRRQDSLDGGNLAASTNSHNQGSNDQRRVLVPRRHSTQISQIGPSDASPMVKQPVLRAASSPSLRSRVSASPSSLLRLTAELKASKVRRREKDTARRLSVGILPPAASVAPAIDPLVGHQHSPNATNSSDVAQNQPLSAQASPASHLHLQMYLQARSQTNSQGLSQETVVASNTGTQSMSSIGADQSKASSDKQTERSGDGDGITTPSDAKLESPQHNTSTDTASLGDMADLFGPSSHDQTPTKEQDDQSVPSPDMQQSSPIPLSKPIPASVHTDDLLQSGGLDMQVNGGNSEDAGSGVGVNGMKSKESNAEEHEHGQETDDAPVSIINKDVGADEGDSDLSSTMNLAKLLGASQESTAELLQPSVSTPASDSKSTQPSASSSALSSNPDTVSVTHVISKQKKRRRKSTMSTNGKTIDTLGSMLGRRESTVDVSFGDETMDSDGFRELFGTSASPSSASTPSTISATEQFNLSLSKSPFDSNQTASDETADLSDLNSLFGPSNNKMSRKSSISKISSEGITSLSAINESKDDADFMITDSSKSKSTTAPDVSEPSEAEQKMDADTNIGSASKDTVAPIVENASNVGAAKAKSPIQAQGDGNSKNKPVQTDELDSTSISTSPPTAAATSTNANTQTQITATEKAKSQPFGSTFGNDESYMSNLASPMDTSNEDTFDESTAPLQMFTPTGKRKWTSGSSITNNNNASANLSNSKPTTRSSRNILFTSPHPKAKGGGSNTSSIDPSRSRPESKPLQGILSSRKKRRPLAAAFNKFNPRTVAFGSPEAAEYRIGSPSISLTPMPQSKAKALFGIRPAHNIDVQSPDQAPGDVELQPAIMSGEDATIEIEANLDLLVNNMKDSAALSPIANTESDAASVVDPMTLKINGQDPTSDSPLNVDLSKSLERANKKQDTSDSSSTSLNLIGTNEKTVELEIGMDQLLAQTSSKPANGVSSPASLPSTQQAPTPSSNMDTSKQESTTGHSDVNESSSRMSFDSSDDTTMNSIGSRIQQPFLTAPQKGPAETTVELEEGMTNVLSAAMVASALAGSNVAPTIDEAASMSKQSEDGSDGAAVDGAGNDDDMDTDSDSEENGMDEDSMVLPSSGSEPSTESKALSIPANDDIAQDAEQETGVHDLEDDMTTLLKVAISAPPPSAAINISSEETTDLPSSVDDILKDSASSQSTDASEDSAQLETPNESDTVHPTGTDTSEMSMTLEDAVTKDDPIQAQEPEPKHQPHNSRLSLASAKDMWKDRVSIGIRIDPDASIDENKSHLNKSTAGPQDEGSDNNGNGTSMHGEDSAEKDNSEGNRSTNKQDDESVSVAATSDDIFNAVNVFSDDTFNAFAARTSDAMVRLGLSTHELGNGIVTASVLQFVEAMCSEIESRTESEDCIETSFQSWGKQQPDMFANFLQGLKGDDAAALGMKRNLESVGRTLSKHIEDEWMEWLSSVLEFLAAQVPIESMSMDLTNDDEALHGALRTIDGMKGMIRRMGEKSTFRAKRKSLARRNNMVSTLEDSVDDLEHELEEARRILQSKKDDHAAISNEVHGIAREKSLRRNYLEKMKVVASSQQGYQSIKGMTNWSPESINGGRFSLVFRGPTKMHSMRMMIDGATCAVDASVISAHNASKENKYAYQYYLPLSRELIDLRTDRLCTELNRYSAGPEPQTATFMRKIIAKTSRSLARLEILASEVERLGHRYGVRVKHGIHADSNRFAITVSFAGCAGEVEAQMFVEEGYASTPIKIDLKVLKGEAGQERAIKRKLLKSNCIGFGGMMQSCDIIAAMVR